MVSALTPAAAAGSATRKPRRGVIVAFISATLNLGARSKVK
jgi:hypothetical protein